MTDATIVSSENKNHSLNIKYQSFEPTKVEISEYKWPIIWKTLKNSLDSKVNRSIWCFFLLKNSHHVEGK